MRKLSCLLVLFHCITFAHSQSNISKNITEKKEVIYSQEVYFDFGAFDLQPEADSTLNELLTFCKDKKNISLQLTAHTDAIGSAASNLTLSQNRLNSVQSYLEDNELMVDSLSTSVFGESKPVADNDSEIGRQRNRRATIEVFQLKKLFKIEGAVVDKETGKGIAADVIIRTKESKDSIKTDTTGYFSSIVPLGAVVGIETYSKGYFLESTMLKALPGKMPELKYELAPIKVGEKVDIKNMYFVGGQAVLLKKSEPELPKILRFMQINSCTKIEIAGHVNYPNRPNVNTTSSEYILSVNRAKLVYNYLIENGIPEDRITYKGYGNWEMRYPKARTESYMAANRRVEIRVLDTKIDKK